MGEFHPVLEYILPQRAEKEAHIGSLKLDNKQPGSLAGPSYLLIKDASAETSRLDHCTPAKAPPSMSLIDLSRVVRHHQKNQALILLQLLDCEDLLFTVTVFLCFKSH